MSDNHQKQSPEEMLKNLLLDYKPDRFFEMDKPGFQCNFCRKAIQNSRHWFDSDFHKKGCPLPIAMRWMEKENE